VAEPTVAAGFARALMELAVSRGAGHKALARRSGVSPEELRDADGRIPLAKYVALMRAAKELCRDPAFALHFGEEVDLSEVSVVGQFGSTSGRMADDIADLNRFAPLAIEFEGDGDRFRLERIDGRLWLVDARPDPNDFPELTESFFARVVCSLRRRLGEGRHIESVMVTHAAPAYRAEYDRIFRVPVLFRSERNALLPSKRLWSTEGADSVSRYVSGVLRQHAEALLEKLKGSRSTRGRVERSLASLLRTGDATMDVVARRLGLTRQTLFRRLRAEGATFEQVRDELRRDTALKELGGGKLSVKEAAYRLGYSDPAAFSRAFKRWTGRRPGAWRSPIGGERSGNEKK
jgi:AraC-like DNA-binding protein